MSGYTKLFSDIVDSSIWDQPSDVCKVWVTLLALANADGLVRGSVGWLAGKAKVDVHVCDNALHYFADPDPRSRTPEHEGRRIEVMEDGWLILNYLAFRDRLSNDPQAVRTRERVRKHRERYKALRNKSNGEGVTSADPASASASSSDSEGGEGPGEGDIKWTLADCLKAAQPIGMTKEMVEAFWVHYASVGFIDGAGREITHLPAALAKWKANQSSHGKKYDEQAMVDQEWLNARKAVARAIQIAKAEGKDELKRAMSAQRDKYRDQPRNLAGEDCVDAGIEWGLNTKKEIPA